MEPGRVLQVLIKEGETELALKWMRVLQTSHPEVQIDVHLMLAFHALLEEPGKEAQMAWVANQLPEGRCRDFCVELAGIHTGADRKRAMMEHTEPPAKKIKLR